MTAAAAVRQLHNGAVPVASWILVGNNFAILYYSDDVLRCVGLCVGFVYSGMLGGC